MWSSENLDSLNSGGWEVFIALTSIPSVVVDGAPDSPVVHRTWHYSVSGACHVSCPLGFGAVDRWGPLSSSCTGQSGASWLCWVTSGRALFTFVVDRCAQVTVALLTHQTLFGAHWTVQWIIAERPLRKLESGQFVGALTWAPNSVRCATGSTIASLCSKLGWVPNWISFLVYVELYAPEIIDNWATF
jgi:hypothetical protein